MRSPAKDRLASESYKMLMLSARGSPDILMKMRMRARWKMEMRIKKTMTEMGSKPNFVQVLRIITSLNLN